MSKSQIVRHDYFCHKLVRSRDDQLCTARRTAETNQPQHLSDNNASLIDRRCAHGGIEAMGKAAQLKINQPLIPILKMTDQPHRRQIPL